MPLVVRSSSRQGQQQVVLHTTTGQPNKWPQPQEIVQRLVHLIKHEVGQTEQEFEYYEQYLAMIQALGLGNHPDVASSLNNLGQPTCA
ncbi:MAG: tetratricopeptide repeat protein [Bacteroidota bacterium]